MALISKFVGRRLCLRKFFILIVIGFSCLLTGCAFYKYNHTKNSIGELVSDQDNIVYIKESNVYVPYLVVSNNYNGNTLLLRKEVLNEYRRINSYSSFYEDSEIDQYLNGEFFSQLNDMKDIIINTDILITDDNAIGVSGSKVKNITRNVFLLSSTELDIDSSGSSGKEGKALKYFKSTDHRIAYQGDTPVSWWTRTADTNFASCTIAIGSNGNIGMTNANDMNGIRPAFCVPNATKIVQSNQVVSGKEVYIFSF